MDLSHFSGANPLWEVFGLFGQTLFGSRFIYQWFMSERAKKSIMPVGFWYLSITGSVITMIYAYHKASFAFMIPTLTGLPVYLRNLVLIYREKRRLAAGTE